MTWPLIIAVAPQDYEHVVSQNILFDICATRACVRIQIVNDLILEEDETFDISLTCLERWISVNPSHATVKIVRDAESKLLRN